MPAARMTGLCKARPPASMERDGMGIETPVEDKSLVDYLLPADISGVNSQLFCRSNRIRFGHDSFRAGG
jgi:hypothetical protein